MKTRVVIILFVLGALPLLEGWPMNTFEKYDPSEDQGKLSGKTLVERTEEERRAADASQLKYDAPLDQQRTSGYEEKNILVLKEEPEGEEQERVFDISRLNEKISAAYEAQQAWKEDQQKIANVAEELSFDVKNRLWEEAQEDVNYWRQQSKLVFNVPEDAVEKFGKDLFKFQQAARAALEEARKTRKLLEKSIAASQFLEAKTEHLPSEESSRSSSREHEEALQQFKKLHTPDPNLSTEEKVSYHTSEIAGLLGSSPSREKKEQSFPIPKATIINSIKNVLERFSNKVSDASLAKKITKKYREEAEHFQSSLHLLGQKAQAACEELEYATAISFYNEALQLGATALSHLESEAKTYQSSAWRNSIPKTIDALQKTIKEWNIEKSQTVQKLAERNRLDALEQERIEDQKESNEIGETFNSIARKFEAIQRQSKRAEEAYIRDDVVTAQDFERKINILEERIKEEEQHLQFLRTMMEKWKRDYQTEASRYLETQEETQPDGTKIVRSIYKRRFIGPLMRIEKRLDAHGHVITEAQMAAEYLMVELKRGERAATFIEKLKEDFPDNNLSIESVEPNCRLYRLNFQTTPSSHDPTPLLNLFTRIKKTLEDRKLALSCFPSIFLTPASSMPPQKESIGVFPEPWSLYPPFGVNPPDNLFDVLNPAISPTGIPIRVAILDSGIRETHQAFINNIIRREDDAGEIYYGYNACASDPKKKELPEDKTGHGTHIAGILAGLPQLVHQVEKRSQSDPHLFEIHNIDEAIIRGIASMPGMVELLVCKMLEPGQNEGVVDRALECIQYAREQGAQIINCSWGGAQNHSGEFSPENLGKLKRSLSNPYEIFRKDDTGEIVSYAPPRFAPPVLVVSAAGNLRQNQHPQERDKDLFHSYPAGFPLPNAITVAATRKDGELAKFSYYGRQSVQITAPGTAIISASYNGDNIYRILSGTSMAAPLTTGAAVLIMKKFSELSLSPQKVIEHLCNQANRIEPPEIKVQSGRLDLTKALATKPTSLQTDLETELDESQKKLQEEKELSLRKKSQSKLPKPNK